MDNVPLYYYISLWRNDTSTSNDYDENSTAHENNYIIEDNNFIKKDEFKV
jgi:hypothetical protein